MALTVATVLLVLGTCFIPFWCCGCCIQLCGGFAYLACVIVTGVFRFRSEGSKCSKSDALVIDDTKFSDHGDLIKDLFISQCALYLVFSIWANVILGVSA